jgi:hypothetical protein
VDCKSFDNNRKEGKKRVTLAIDKGKQNYKEQKVEQGCAADPLANG